MRGEEEESGRWREGGVSGGRKEVEGGRGVRGESDE